MFQLDDFFRVYQTDTLPNGEEVSVRVLSDTELSAKQSYMLAESIRMSEALKDENSEEYKTRIAPLQYASDVSLIETIVTANRVRFIREAIETYRVQFFPYPDKADLQEKLEIEKQQAEHEKQIGEARTEYVKKAEATLGEKLSELDHGALVKEAIAKAIQLYTTDAGMSAATYYTIWCAVEKNGKKRWATSEEIKQLPAYLIDHLYAKSQEVDRVDAWSLTKSQPQRDSDRLDGDIGNGGRNGSDSR